LPWWKTLYLGILAGAYIGFGSCLALSVGGAVPGIVAAGGLGVQRMIFGAFGLPFGGLPRPAPTRSPLRTRSHTRNPRATDAHFQALLPDDVPPSISDPGRPQA
jgi:hypothetical protein